MRMSTIAIALFCIFMTCMTVWNCWVKPDTNKYKIIASLITIGTGITGFLVLLQMMPTPASPQVNDLYFYAAGTTNDFMYCSEFLIRNDGANLCELEKVEYILPDVKFRPAKSIFMAVGQGGGNVGVLGGSGGVINNIIVSSYFPQTISSISQSFKLVGKGENSKTDKSELKNFGQIEVNVSVKFYFKSQNKQIIIERNVPIISRGMENIRF